MSSDFSSILHALKAKRCGGSWIARCPAHDDHNPSLSINELNGKILVHCHAGCEQRDVIAKVRTLASWRSQSCGPPNQKRREIIYAYTDEHGRPLYEVVRCEPGRNGKPKSFSQRYHDGHGAWIWRKYPKQVLYRLPEVLSASIVFVVEGEKDVETLRSYGFAATTNAGGCEAKWLDSYTEALCGREVIIIPDADVPGRKRARHIARAILGRAARVAGWEPDDAKDVTDWFHKGHSEIELIEAVTPDIVQS